MSKVELRSVRLRNDVVQWKGRATDRWETDDTTEIHLVGDPPSFIVINDLATGDHTCLSFDRLQFTYTKPSKEKLSHD